MFLGKFYKKRLSKNGVRCWFKTYIWESIYFRVDCRHESKLSWVNQKSRFLVTAYSQYRSLLSRTTVSSTAR